MDGLQSGTVLRGRSLRAPRQFAVAGDLEGPFAAIRMSRPVQDASALPC